MDGQTLREIPLVKERTTIGRKPQNDIHIDNLAVSGEHAVIVSILNDAFLEDLGSTNGTVINGKAVKKHFLQNNDVIELGKFKLKFVAEKSATPSPSDYEKTMIMRAPVVGKAPEVVKSSAPTPAAAPTAPMSEPAADKNVPEVLAAIQIISGPNAGKELELSKKLTTLGKTGQQVAVITRRPQGYFITHVEGPQLPVVNGQTISAQAHLLKDHDVIELAGVKMEFFIKG
jgi:pSer/pThr/pTyr-binding forkhead associated (FHA) protein